MAQEPEISVGADQLAVAVKVDPFACVVTVTLVGGPLLSPGSTIRKAAGALEPAELVATIVKA